MNFREIFIRLVAITAPYLYDNNVSLLELTRKLYEYFHELCTALKSFEDDYSKFKDDTNKNLEDLKTYVDNYFNNLDLSSEVKSVIDSLIADGTLANLINQELLGNINNHLSEIDTELETIKNSIQTNTNDITDLKNYDTTNTANILKLNTKQSVQIATCEANSNYVITNENLELNLNDVVYVHFNNAIDDTKDATLTINNVAKNVIKKDGSLFKGKDLENTDLILKVGNAGLYQIVDIATLMSLINNANNEISSLQTLVDSINQDVINNTDGIHSLSDFVQFTEFKQFAPSDFTLTTSDGTTNAGTLTNVNGGIAYNKDYSKFRIYGRFYYTLNSQGGSRYLNIKTPLRPTKEIQLSSVGFSGNVDAYSVGDMNAKIKTDGTLSLICQSHGTSGNTNYARIFTSDYTVKDFGDSGEV